MKNERDFVLKITYKIKTPEEEEVYQKAKGDLSHQAFIDQAVKRHIHELNKNNIDLGVVKEEKVGYSLNRLNILPNLNNEQKMKFSFAIHTIRKSLPNSPNQVVFANLVGIGLSTIKSWESGKQENPQINLVTKLLRTLKNHWSKNTENKEINEAFLTLQNYIN